MREILFRGERSDDKEWVFGDLEHNGNHIPKFVDGYTIDPSTVGQFTGLTDKNGKKIFEGDIIKVIAGNPVGEPIVAKIIPNLNDYELMWDIEHSYEIEIVGNIHDNPELLEVTDNA